MKVHGLTVCVDYADYLSVGIERLMSGLESLTVVTTPDDTETRILAERHGARVHETDVFYQRGAAFNKGAAMEEARMEMPWEDWALFVDSDIVPPVNWLLACVAANPAPGNLYSAWRHQCDNADDLNVYSHRIRGDGVGVGYWQLFHTSDRALESLPIVETHWSHAGNYDNGFMHRWPRAHRHILPIRLQHLGQRDNWFGRGQQHAFDAMQAERKRRGGRWDHECIQPVDAT